MSLPVHTCLAAGQPVPPGGQSDALLVTNLANDVQSVIRYQLGDSVVVSNEPCQCGSPLATISLEGRTSEILRVPCAGGGEAGLLPMAIATMVEETAAPKVRRSLEHRFVRHFDIRDQRPHHTGTDRSRACSGGVQYESHGRVRKHVRQHS